MKINKIRCFKCILLIYFSFANIAAQAQISLDSEFNMAYEISAITKHGNFFYLPQEKCKKILLVDTLSFKTIQKINLDKGILKNIQVGIEGIALFQKYLLFTDEKNAKIFSINLEDSIISNVKTNYDLTDHLGNYGMEGITVDSRNGLCYVLKERNNLNQSEIHVFKIIAKHQSIQLQFVKDLIIQHNSSSWRYSDIFFNEHDKAIYCLKSKYITGSPHLSKYMIETIDSGQIQNSFPDTTKVKFEPDVTLYKNITNAIFELGRKGFSTNLEGLTIVNNELYIVSDNMQQVLANCAIPGQGRTLILKLNM